MLKAQERGHRQFHYLAEDLSYETGVGGLARHGAAGAAITKAGEVQVLDLAGDVDVVRCARIRFDIGYITATACLSDRR